MLIARQAIWALMGVGGQQTIRFVVLIILARLLSPAEFGVIAAAQIIFAFAETFVDFGLGVGLVRAPQVDEETKRSAMTIVIVSSASISVVIAYVSRPLSILLGIPEVEFIIPWMALVFVLNGITGPLFQLMFRNGRFREVSLLQLLSSGLGYGTVAIVLAILGWGYWSIVVALLVQSVIQLALSFSMMPVWPTLRPAWTKLRPILHFGAGLLLANQLNTLARKADNWIAGKYLGATALGFYSRAYSLMDLANQIPGVIFNRVLMPHFAQRAHSLDEPRIAVRQFYLSHFTAAASMLPISLGTVILAPDIVRVLLGNGWQPVAPALRILGGGIFLRLAYKISSTVSLAYGASWKASIREGVYAAIVIGGSLLGMANGIVGVALAVLLALFWQFWAQTTLALTLIEGRWRDLVIAVLPLFVAIGAALLVGISADILLCSGSGAWLRIGVIGLGVMVPYSACLWLFRHTMYTASFVRLFADLVGLRRRLSSPGQRSTCDPQE